MSDFQRTQSAIDYYRQNNMYDQLAAAQAYAQSMGYNIPSTPVAYDDIVPHQKADPGPYGYITVTPRNEKEFSESWNICSNYRK